MSSSAQLPRQSGSFKSKDLGDEYLFYDESGDRVHVLNGSARAIYMLCDGTKTEDEVSSAFAELYDLDHETALEDTSSTIRQLLEIGLLSLPENP